MACGRAISAATVEELPDDELMAVILCRLAELRSVGCDTYECFVLAVRVDVSLEAAVDLVERGCPAELMLPILL